MELLPNPWTEGAAWDRLTLAGVTFTGKVEITGDLLKKKSDHRRARGRNGGRSVATGWDLVEFSVTLTAFPYGADGRESTTWAELQEILRRVGRGAVSTQDTTAHAVSHPELAAVGITQVTMEGLSFGAATAGGAKAMTLKLKEWRAPTQAPGARAPAAAPQSSQGRPAAKAIPNTGTITPIGDRYEGREIPLRPSAPAAPSTGP